MRVLVAGNGGLLADALVASLSTAHDVRVIAASDALDRDPAAQASAGREVVVHFPLAAESAASPLDALDVAGRATYNLITTATEAKRFVLISTLRHFERYPAEWHVTERWAPRPTTDVSDLASYLAEIVVREAARVLPLKGIALRLGEVVTDEMFRSNPADSRWVHLDDALHAVERALAFGSGTSASSSGWSVFHIPGGGSHTRFPLGQAGEPAFGYAPRHEVGAPAAPAPPPQTPPDAPATVSSSRTPITAPGSPRRRVVVFGAGGPIGAVFAASAAADHVLRLADIRPLAEIVAENRPQNPGAPVPRLFDPPHEARVVDITDPDQVLAAAEGMDAIVNVTAMRNHPIEAFRVNMLGSYNVMRAAVAHGIRRVVQTGPSQISLAGPAGYTYDDDVVSSDLPARPGTELYFVSKLLGQQICCAFAYEHHIEVPCLLIGPLLNPAGTPSRPHGAYPFSVSWADAGEAVHWALHAPPLPRPFEPLFVVADLPHGRFSNEKTKRLLGWVPRDRLDRH
ncbi:MAG: NAD(P)-dependent oxidoreductase [Chloroflexi bacterium]|nr:NAD(P)-dependent oxidoreductase [Chloroflexota bacterium]